MRDYEPFLTELQRTFNADLDDHVLRFREILEKTPTVGLEIPARPLPNISRYESLKRYSVARLGGPADIVIEIPEKNVKLDLIYTISLCWKHAIPYFIVGNGSNILFSDQGFRGVVIAARRGKWTFIRNPEIDEYELYGVTHYRLEPPGQGYIEANAGCNLIQLARETMEAGCSGLEWAISVPGTVGGAVVNNAGAYGSDIAANLIAADILSESGTSIRRTWRPNDLKYSYRTSALKHAPFRYVVLSATFKLEPDHDPAALRAKADEYLAHRKRTQPPGASLGSMFKNPPGDYAGRLIEAAGLKGTQRGGVMISPVHANFFINTGGGTASDYLALIRLAQETVADKFGVKLELEIELVGQGFEDVNR